MPQYVGFDSSITDRPSPVLGWYDTDFTDRLGIAYAHFPQPNDLLMITHEQYLDRFSGTWGVQAGKLVPCAPTSEIIPTPS